mgnify:CR=1 FL=1
MKASSPNSGRGPALFALKRAVVAPGFVVGAFLAGPALATHDNGNQNSQDGGNGGNGGNGGQGGQGGSAHQFQGQGQHQGQSQGQGQHQSSYNKNSNTNVNVNAPHQGQFQGQSADNKGVSQDVTINNPRPGTSGPGIASNPSAPCRIAAGISGGWIGGSAGVFGSVADEGCDTREDARFIREVLGDLPAALKRACKKAEIAEALGAKCAPAAMPAKAAAVPGEYRPISFTPDNVGKL